MFRNETMRLGVAAIVLITFFNLTLYPRTAAAQPQAGNPKADRPSAPKGQAVPGSAVSADERFAVLLNTLHEDLKAAVPQAAGAGRGAHALRLLQSPQLATTASRIRANSVELKKLYADIDQSFKRTGQHLKDARLPQEVLGRHEAAVAQYESRKAEFDRVMSRLEQAPSGSEDLQRGLDALARFMAKYPSANPHQRTDPNKLPFRMAGRSVRAPHETSKQYQARLFRAAPSKPKTATGVARLSVTPASGDLAETEDVQLTQAIRAQATALNNNPVNIYNWVRSNIRFIPSYGSMQGSHMTLQSKRGNAFDTASLLIALLRAAGIPSRYVYGTIEVPANEVMNWVGGVTTPHAALSLLGQGGIPSIGIISGGAIRTIKLEHVWAEAYVDYVPSRGAINRQPQTWVPLDASFKQYTFTQGMNLKAQVPLDTQALLSGIMEGATVDEAQGSILNLNQANLQSQAAAYHQQVRAYVENQRADATVGEVLGIQTIAGQNHPFLTGSLPYKIVATGNIFQALPASMRWKFKTSIAASPWPGGSGSPLIEINQSTASLAGKKITLSFVPATQADQALIDSYMPRPHADGTPIDPSEYPRSLPGYLLNMKAELRIDGQAVALTSQSFTMGSTVRQASQFFNPATGAWSGGSDNDITVGEYNAIGINLQGLSAHQYATHQAKVEATRARLARFQQNPNDSTPVTGLTKEDLTGDVLQGGILAYFVQVDASDTLAARSTGNVTSYRLPSYGRFFTAAETHYWFGIPRSVSFPGVGLDVDYLFQHAEAKNGDPTVLMNFIREVGAAGSAAEHTVPETLFHNPNPPPNAPAQPQGVSAVKALALAGMQGQKIYTLNQSNRSLHGTILQSLQISQDVKSEIADALAANKEVTVHERDINVNGWIGCGYTILDPAIGAGAYKIAGGSNGGFLRWVDSNSGLLGLGAWALALAGGVWFFLAVLLVITIVAAGIIAFLEDSDGSCGFGPIALYASLQILLAIAGVFARPIHAWIFWVLGFQADGGIRAALTHCNR